MAKKKNGNGGSSGLVWPNGMPAVGGEGPNKPDGSPLMPLIQPASAVPAPTTGDPPGGEYRQLPIVATAGADRLKQIENILATHDQGNFNLSALLADAMLRDDRINGDLTTRQNGLIGTRLVFEPSNQSRKARQVAELLGGDEDTPGLWAQMAPPSQLADLLRWGLLLGVGIGELVWEERDGLWIPRLKTWHPQFCYWRWDTQSYWLITAGIENLPDGTRVEPNDGQHGGGLLAQYGGYLVELPRVDRDLHSNGKWLLYTPYGYHYGWLRALIRTLSYRYMDRRWGYRDYARYNEVHGLPMRKAKVPSRAPEVDKDRFFRSIRDAGSEIVVECPVDQSGENFDVELVEAKADTYRGFLEFLNKVEASIAIAILGQDLTSKPTTGGSLAQAKDNIRDDYRRFDARTISQVAFDQMIYHFTVYNFGDPELASSPKYEVDPPEDEKEEAASLQAVGNALVAFADASAPVDARALLDIFGVPTLEEGEVSDLRPPQPSSPPPGGSPTGGTPPRGEQRSLPEAHRDARADRALAYGGGAYQLPADHLAAMMVSKGGSSCSSCDFFDADGKRCKSEDYQRWAGTDKLVNPESGAEVPPDEFCSDWWVPRDTNHPIVDRYDFQGFTLAIENKAGTEREISTGQRFLMHFDYGYIEGVQGADGDEVDVYVGPDETAEFAYVVHQRKAPEFKSYDEDKVMLGFRSADDAREAYVRQYDDPRFFGTMSSIPVEDFRRKLKRRTGSGPIRAREPRVVIQPAERLVQLRAGSIARRRQVRYQDRLAARAAERARGVMSPDLAAVMAEVRAASSYEDLRTRLVKRFRGMKPGALAKLVERARIMAQLAGRGDVLDKL